jgi:hypothetical protein
MTITDTAALVIQTVVLECGHEVRYRIGRPLAESGFARTGTPWRCVRCDEHGTTTRLISTVRNTPAHD